MAASIACLVTACSGGATVYEPVPVSADYLVYVPVPPELTEPLPVATGPLRDCPTVAKARAAALAQCNADRAAVASLQGTAAPAAASQGGQQTAPAPAPAALLPGRVE